MDYTAYQCETFRREWNQSLGSEQLLLDPVFADGPDGRTITDVSASIPVCGYGQIYVMNAAGKTIDSFNQVPKAPTPAQ